MVSVPLPMFVSRCSSPDTNFGSRGALERKRSPNKLNSTTCPFAGLLDDLVDAQACDVRYRKAECCGGLHVQHDLVSHRCLHWQVDRPFALENAVDIAGGSSKRYDLIGAVRDQSALFDISAERIDCGQPIQGGERNDPLAADPIQL